MSICMFGILLERFLTITNESLITENKSAFQPVKIISIDGGADNDKSVDVHLHQNGGDHDPIINIQILNEDAKVILPAIKVSIIS